MARRIGKGPSDRTSLDMLSTREIQVLRGLALGRSNREIAAELVVSEHTVARHLQNMFRKLGVSSRREALERLSHARAA